MDKPDRVMKVAVAQIDVALLDLEANVRKHLDVIADARARDVDVLVFPELSLTGYLVGEDGWRIGLEVLDQAGPLGRLADAAGDMRVVVGFVEEGFAAQLYNSTIVLRRGGVVHTHRKLNLANYADMEEGKHFARGRYVESFDLKAPFRGAALICSDLWNPALVHLAALHGATCLLAPTNSSLDERSGDVSKPGRWDVFLMHYALIYGLPIVFANRVGREEGYTFWGGSRVISATGEELARAEGDEETLLVADLSWAEVVKARFDLPTVRDSNLDLIGRELDRLRASVGVPASVRDFP